MIAASRSAFHEALGEQRRSASRFSVLAARLTRPTLLDRRQLRKVRVRFLLIPVGDRSDVVGERLIRVVRPPAESLYGDAQVLLETDGVHEVPAIEAPLRWAILARMTERAADIGCRVSLREAVAAEEVIFRTGAVDCRELAVAVHVELDFTLAKPAVGELGPGQKVPT